MNFSFQLEILQELEEEPQWYNTTHITVSYPNGTFSFLYEQKNLQREQPQLEGDFQDLYILEWDTFSQTQFYFVDPLSDEREEELIFQALMPLAGLELKVEKKNLEFCDITTNDLS